MHARLASKGRSYGIFAEVCTQEFKLQESGTREYITLYSTIQFLQILYKHFAYLGVVMGPGLGPPGPGPGARGPKPGPSSTF